jgi:hypothetical protein
MASSKFRYVDGVDADALPLPALEEADLPVYGVEPHEIKTELPPMRSYQEMLAASWTSPTDR